MTLPTTGSGCAPLSAHVIAIARLGLEIYEAARRVTDYEMSLRRSEVGLLVSGVRPRFSARVVIVDRSRGYPHVALIPPPSG